MKELTGRKCLRLFLPIAMFLVLLAGCGTENAPSNSGVGLSELFSTAPWFPKEILIYEGLTEPEPEPRVKPEDFDWANDKKPEPEPPAPGTYVKDPETEGVWPMTEEEKRKQFYERDIYETLFLSILYEKPLSLICHSTSYSWENPMIEGVPEEIRKLSKEWYKQSFEEYYRDREANEWCHIGLFQELATYDSELFRQANEAIKADYWRKGGDGRDGWIGKYTRPYLSDEQMNAILSGDEAEITKSFLSDFSIMVGDTIYTPKMLVESSAEELKAAGITRAMMEDKYVNEWITYFGDTYIRWDLKDKLIQM